MDRWIRMNWTSLVALLMVGGFVAYLANSGTLWGAPNGSGSKATPGGAADSGAKALPAPAKDLEQADTTEATAVFAGGCFWCTEAVFEQVDGVTDVVSGYAGGDAGDANYKAVSRGQTEHAEAIQITYDPAKVSYGELLRIFFGTHDPTTLNRQGPDRGTQYRSAVFYANAEEKAVAQAYIAQLEAAGVFGDPIVTTLEALTQFHPAEDYHQDYVKLNPDNPYVRAWVPQKLKKLEYLQGSE